MALVNEEFLDQNSIAINFDVFFVFNGMQMSIKDSGAAFEICKRSDFKTTYRFQTGYNKASGKPTIAWDGDVPNDLDIRVAADVMVAKLYQKLLGA